MAAKKELRAYKDAVWQFMQEHCDIREGGIFVKFFTKDKGDFEKRVWARQRDLYHRDRDGNEWRRVKHLQRIIDKNGKHVALKEKRGGQPLDLVEEGVQ